VGKEETEVRTKRAKAVGEVKQWADEALSDWKQARQEASELAALAQVRIKEEKQRLRDLESIARHILDLTLKEWALARLDPCARIFGLEGILARCYEIARESCIPDPSLTNHGRRSTYNAGCRCDECRCANAERSRERYRSAALQSANARSPVEDDRKLSTGITSARRRPSRRAEKLLPTNDG
jgi:hypothetical protein